MQIYTIGYQGKWLPELVEDLRDAGIELLLDVREIAWSRKAGFSKKPLSEALAEAGITYRHDRRLGTPAPIRNAYRKSGDWEQLAVDYSAHLATLDDLVADYARELAGQRVCLLCFEAEAHKCHRGVLADALARHGASTPIHL